MSCETLSPIESELDAMLDYAYALRDQLRGAADEPSRARHAERPLVRPPGGRHGRCATRAE